MFGNCNKEALKSKIEYLQSQLNSLEARYQSVLKTRDEWKELAMNGARENNSGNLLIDWSKVEVISIERAPLNRGEIDRIWVTNVSYWKDEVENGLPVKKFKEMIYYTNKRQHDEIIETYNKYVMDKGKKK